MAHAQNPIHWDPDLIQRYNQSGPRYTSYPTAPQFHSGVQFPQWRQAIAASNQSGRPLSLYFHIPFCDTVCYYCGCNKVITANHQRALPYLAALHQEISLQSIFVDPERNVNQLHWGGGTPTYLSDTQIAELMQCIALYFPLKTDDSGEYSIEIHPKTVNPQRLAHLRQLGFNRLSLGVQDFNPDVQAAVNRFNTEQEVAALIAASRDLQYHSISLDLIYGLPLQTPDSFAQTLDSVIQMRPDRLSLFNYAHMPHLFKVQNQIDATQLPEPQTKLRILHDSIEQLVRAGYVYIGMDHFALPTDALTVAQQQGVLQRNFQGYATHGDCDLLAFGVSAISSVDKLFSQNHKTISDYEDTLNNGQLPIAKGITLSQDDLIRRQVINQLICQFELTFAQTESIFDISFADYFGAELRQLQTMANDGLLTIDQNGIRVTPSGRLLIRHICMVFDAYITSIQGIQNHPARYSRIL